MYWFDSMSFMSPFEYKVEHSIRLFRPSANRGKRGFQLLSIQKAKSKQKKSVHDRRGEALWILDNDLRFLSGFLTMLGLVDRDRHVRNGEKMFSDGVALVMGEMRSSKTPTVNTVRRLRVYSEKIRKFVDRVETYLIKAERNAMLDGLD